MRKLTTNEFIERAKNVHGDRYDYSKLVYTNSRDKVCIICKEHGEFWQKANEHLRGHGCDKCGGTCSITTNEFIKRAIGVHGNKYDYSKTNYINSSTKVCIICKEHGEFWQLPLAHLNGSGCPKCVGMNKTTEDIISEFRQVHGDRYDYSKVKYISNDTKVCIICSEHGEFYQAPSKHLYGQGCPKCGIDNRVKKQFLNTEQFINKAKKVHGDRYDYSNVEYVSMRTKVCIKCNKHGEFWQYPFDHINEHGCPKCGIIMSNAEEEICEYLYQYIDKDEIIRHDREILNGKEIDIYLPKYKVGIEYNGIKWHSEEYGKDNTYHISKLNECNKIGIKLIQIFDDEYNNHKDVVLNKIKHIINVNDCVKKIYARKCVISEINKVDSSIFLNKYHIQGYGKCSKSYGCYYNDELVGVMSFRRENNNNNDWELVRFATNYNYICCGIGGKLFKYFLKYNDVDNVKTFADRRWTTDLNDNLYLKIGFKQDSIIKPDYRYINPQNPDERMHKFSFRKWNLHVKYGVPLSITETQMCNKLGFKKIWDCGLVKYIWKKES